MTTAAQPATDRDKNQSVYEAYLRFGDLVRGGRVTPGWILGGPSFWFAEGGPQDRQIWIVDPVANTKRTLCDVDQLRKALTDELGFEPAGRGFPFAALAFVSPTVIAFGLEGVSLLVDLESFAITRQPEATTLDMMKLLVSETGRATPRAFFQDNFAGLGQLLVPEAVPAGGKWFASAKDGNIVLRSSIDGQEVRLTEDGTETQPWLLETTRWQPWSPSGDRLVAIKCDTTGMVKVPTIHWLKPLPQADEVHWIPAGGVLPRDEIYVLDVHRGTPVHIELGDTTDTYLVVLGWKPDGEELFIARYDRLLTQVEILGADPRTGATRLILTERSETFLTNHHWAIWGRDTGFTLLPDGSGFILRSERDGWAHFYRYDLEGNLVARLTEGAFPVLSVTRIDQAEGWLYFQAHGEADRPYDNHLYRVSLDGGPITRLTEGEGRHEITFAPLGGAFVDCYSSASAAPRTVLRSAAGEELQVLGESDISALEQVGYVPSKEYVVKAADGQTDLWVTVHFPHDFDPSKKYPVIQHIYGGPQVAKRAMDFGLPAALPPGMADQFHFTRALAQHGFLVVTLDGRGTPGRSKAFQDAIYRSWGTFEIDDHAGAIRQLAAKESFVDLDRVGITGGSWGGHYTFRALVQAPDVYTCGISECPGYDSRAMTLYEPYLGLPADNKALYDTADALQLAPRLTGKLLQTGGTNDTGTQGEFYRMSEALVRAGIQHDTMAYPNAGHGFSGASGRYNNQLKLDWFIRQLNP